jgi:8-oxo-dGTP pyrophosphatase MutT (NUDIX family)
MQDYTEDYRTVIFRLRQALVSHVPRSRRQQLAPQLSYGRHHGPPTWDARLASVLVVLYPRHDGWYLPLTVRPFHLPTHAGQVSFPGGALDRDETSRSGAIREWHEELGAPGVEWDWIGELPSVYVFNSNYHVTPSLAMLPSRPSFQPNAAEVAELLEVPAAHLLDERHWGEHIIVRGAGRFRAPHIEFQGHRIWGATAIIIENLLPLLRLV